MSDGNVYKMFSNNSNSLGNTLEHYSMHLVNVFQTINTSKSQTPKTDPNVFSLTDKGYQDFFFSVSATLPSRWTAVEIQPRTHEILQTASEQLLTVQRCSNWQWTCRKFYSNALQQVFLHSLRWGHMEIRLIRPDVCSVPDKWVSNSTLLLIPNASKIQFNFMRSLQVK